MTEHLDADQFALRTADMLLFYLPVDVSHLIQVQLTRQHHDISKLGIEFQCLDIRDVQLSRQMYLHTLLATIGHHSDITGYHSRYLSLNSSVNNLMHQFDVLAIDNGVDRQI